MKKKLLLLNATGVGLFILLAVQLVLGSEEAQSSKQLPPAITGFAPAYGLPGEVVTVSVANLKASSNEGYVFRVNGIPADVIKADRENHVQIRVPRDASSGRISLEEYSGRALASSQGKFEVIPGVHQLYRQRPTKY